MFHYIIILFPEPGACRIVSNLFKPIRNCTLGCNQLVFGIGRAAVFVQENTFLPVTAAAHFRVYYSNAGIIGRRSFTGSFSPFGFEFCLIGISICIPHYAAAISTPRPVIPASCFGCKRARCIGRNVFRRHKVCFFRFALRFQILCIVADGFRTVPCIGSPGKLFNILSIAVFDNRCRGNNDFSLYVVIGNLTYIKSSVRLIVYGNIRAAVSHINLTITGTDNAAGQVNTASFCFNVFGNQITGLGVIIHLHNVFVGSVALFYMFPAVIDLVQCFRANFDCFRCIIGSRCLNGRVQFHFGYYRRIGAETALDQAVNVDPFRRDEYVIPEDIPALARGYRSLVCCIS